MEQKAVKNENQKPNLLLAIFAAIGLGLVGCVLYGVLYYVGYIAWIASYVAVIAAAWGYKHFNKKMDWKGYLTVAIVTIGGLLIAMFIALTLVVSKEFGSSFSVAFKDLFTFLDTNTKLRNAFVRDAILTAVFTLLGLLSYFFYEKRLTKANKEVFENKTAVPEEQKKEEPPVQPKKVEKTETKPAEKVSAQTKETKPVEKAPIQTKPVEKTIAQTKTQPAKEPVKVETKTTPVATPVEKKVVAVPTENKPKTTTKKKTVQTQSKPLVIKPVVASKPKTTAKKTDKKSE